MKPLLLLACPVALSGCMGTVASRVFRQGWSGTDPFGAYPYEAVAADAYTVYQGGRKISMEWYLIPVGIVSLPVDLAIDTVLLPVDLVCWPLGFSKDG